MKLIFSSALAAVLAVAPVLQARAQALPSNSIDNIVAVVNEDVILRSELDLAVDNITKQFAANQGGQLPPREVLEKQVLERLVIMRLQIERAADSGIRVTEEELQAVVSTIAGQNKMTVEQLRQRLVADNLGFEEFQANLRDEVLVQRLRQRYVQSSVQVRRQKSTRRWPRARSAVPSCGWPTS